MKKIYFVFLIVLLNGGMLFSQVAINSDGSAPHPSAGLDVNFTNKGFLLPRMTFNQLNAIQNPAEGLIVYCTNCMVDASGVLAIYQGGLWRMFNLNCFAPNLPSPGTHVPSVNQIIWNWSIVPIAIGFKWNTINDYNTAIDLGMSTTNIETGLTCWTSYTRYVWAYNSCGQSMGLTLTQSTLQIPFSPAPTGATSPATSTSIIWNWNAVNGATGYRWNTINDPATAIDMGAYTYKVEGGLTCNTSFTRYVWAYNACGISTSTSLTQSTTLDTPATPVSGTHVPSPAQIVWNWNTVTGATGYKWNTTNNYATATDKGTATTHTEMGLSCNTSYTRYVWAYNNCDVSVSRTLTQATSLDPPAAPVPATHVPSPVQIVWNWNTVAGAAGYKWNTTNNYATATDMATATTKTETGLTCNTPYSRYVWAYNSCGVSTTTTLTQSTSLDPPSAPVTATHVPSPVQIVWNWNTVAGAAGYKWNTTNNYATATDMATLTTKTETGLTCNTSYSRYVWSYNNCGVSAATTLVQVTSLDPPAAPVAATHVPSPLQIIWNWNTVAGATGYKWNTTNNYATATDMATLTTKTETGLTCNTSYTRFVWSYSNCGVSAPTTLTQATSLDPPAAPVTGTHVPSPVQIVWNWNTVAGAAGYKWNTTNNYATATDMASVTTKTETGLTCNTPYNRYVWAYNSCGVSTATTLTQTTSLDPPAAPVTGTHVPSPAQIVWNWNTVAGATGYKWNTINNYGSATDMLTAITKTETSLTCNTSYTRYVWAYSNCGVSSVTTLSQATSLDPPAAPVAATHVPSPTQIIWNWNTVAGATGYKWNTINNYGSATDMGTATTRTETNLTCNSPYTRYVWAYSSCGVSSVTALTQATSTDPPAAPVTGTHVPSPTQVVWNWNTVAGAAGYKWNTTNNYASATDMATLTTKTETGLTCNTPYNRFVWAYNNCGVSSTATLTQTTSLDPPAAPVAATHVPSPTQIVWNWNTVAGAAGYKWSTTNNYATATDMGTSTSHTEISLTCNTSYTRYVWSYNNCGVSNPTTLAQATSLDPPAAPVTGTHVPSPAQIVWNWNTVAGATGYKWSTTNNFATATDMGTATTHTETGITCNTSYTRYVWAYSNCGTSASSTLTSVTPHEAPDPPVAATHVPSPTQIIWNWNTVPGATGYKWNTTNNYTTATDMFAITTKTETGLTCNTSYTRYVWAYNGCDPSAPTTLTQLSALDPPASPTPATHVPSLTQIVWNWNTVAGATGYKWSTTNDYGTATDMGAATTHTETSLTCNTSYTRYVWAYNNCGNSAPGALTQATSVNPPSPPVAGTHVASAAQIIWNWNTVAGATGYKWNTTNDYGTATDKGTATTHTESGLSCNTSYTRYVWAYGNCGSSTSTSLTKATTNTAPSAPASATHVASAAQIVWNWNTVSGAAGYKWNTTNDYGTAADMGTATTYTEAGLACNTSYTRYVWAYNACGNSTSTSLTQATTNNLPGSPIAGTHVASFTQIVWNWNTVADATGYKWNTVNDYASATNMGTAITYTETNLACGTNYTRYVWAYNGCGQSSSVSLTSSTLSCWSCGSTITINHVAGNVAPVSKTVTYSTVTNIPGETAKCWITSNLGADHQATAVSDATEASAGWYWQFNRMQGYKNDGNTRTPNTTWINNINEYTNWTAANDPCTIMLSNGWRIPTLSEWSNVDNGGGWTTWSGPWNSALKMHAAGYLYYNDGLLMSRGLEGSYWSTTQSNTTQSRSLYFSSVSCNTTSYPKAFGLTIRCIRD